jgi:hypothetical protein
MLSMDDLFKGRHFEREIIILCVRWYLRFKLSFRDLVEIMAERGMRRNISLCGADNRSTACPNATSSFSTSHALAS